MDLDKAENGAVLAAKAVGKLLKANLRAEKKANAVLAHDIKLELDVRSQRLIEGKLGKAFPEVGFLGEEGNAGAAGAAYRWVVDPIDGTVNFAYGIPHACVSIALQGRARRAGKAVYVDGYETLLGVVYDPFVGELWTARKGRAAMLNGERVRVSARKKLEEAVVAIGSPGSKANVEAAIGKMVNLLRRARKVRINGSAALALCYVGSGRFDAYVEGGLYLWDIAAAGLVIECAGGECWREQRGEVFEVVGSNGRVGRELKGK